MTNEYIRGNSAVVSAADYDHHIGSNQKIRSDTVAKKATPAADISLRQWLLTDRSTRRLRKQLRKAERQGATKKELQEMAKRCAADTLLRKAHPTAAAIVYAVLEQTKWAGIVNSILTS